MVGVQNAEIHSVNISEAVVRAIESLLPLLGRHPHRQRLIGEASFAVEEKILSIRRHDGTKSQGAGIDLRPQVDSLRPCALTTKADVEIAITKPIRTTVGDKDEITFVRRDKGITFEKLRVDRLAQILRLAVPTINQTRAPDVAPAFSAFTIGTEIERPIGSY